MKTAEKDHYITEDTSAISQRYLGRKGLIVLIAFMSAFVPLSTDLYLPALPTMQESFGVTPGLLNLTLVFFFIFYAAGTLFWGPLSDKHGRRPILLTGLAIYIAASMLCASAGSVYQLVLFRILQACGGGAVTAVAGAIVKDVYSGRKRATTLAFVQSMVTLAPIAAPVIGALVLKFTSWRGIFWVLAIIGLIAAAGAAAFQETIGQRHTGSTLQSLLRLGIVLRNPGFSLLLFTFSILAIPMMAFISTSSYIYVNSFGLSEQQYSYFFAANALVSLAGPLLFIRLSRRIRYQTIIGSGFIIMSISGLLVSVFGNISPWLFAAALMPATLSIGLIRPPAANLMFEQQQEDTGSASSLISCGFTLLGSAGMMLASLNWTNRIIAIGLGYMLAALFSLVLWLLVSRSPYVRHIELKEKGFDN